MTTTVLTTHLDTKLKDRLETIARYEDCSVSSVANRAIQNLVEEREATRELVKTGRKIADQGISISSQAVNEWFQADDHAPFPEPDTFEKF